MNPTSGVLGEAWELYKKHWQHLIGVAAIVYIGAGLLNIAALALGVIGVLVASIISIIALFWVQGALVHAVQDIRDGRADLSIAETYQGVKGKLGSIAVASILAGLGIGLGLLLLIVPGLYLMTIWVLIVPVIVLENAGAMESFGRSRELVRGWGWSVFGILVLTILLLMAFGIVLGIMLLFLPDWLQSFVSDVISGMLTAPFISLAWTLLYYRLRDARAGTLPEGTAQA